ncbi:MAG TPA: ABC transporter permease subunit [Acidimicrobiales bacterium]|nr:ABC transporter permease subunit [Acidimicrobiales bacterium]
MLFSAAGAAGLALALVVAFLVGGAASGPLHPGRLLTSAVWDAPRGQYGALAMVWGTAAVATIALLLAAPVGWAAAVAISEVAPRRWRRLLRSGTELLAVVPSIVFGLVGIAYVRPFVARVAHVPGGDSLLAAGLVLAVMVVPTVIAVSVDALAAVPGSVREAAAACGLTPAEVIGSAVLPQARRGMRAALLLGLARALGETVAVFLVVGRADGRLPRSVSGAFDLLVHPGQTLTTKLNGPESILAGTSGEHWAALCGLGLILLVAVAGLTLVGQRRAAAGPGGRAVTRLGGASRHRRGRDRAVRVALSGVLALPLVAVAAVGLVVVTKGAEALHPAFWWTLSRGASGGGIRGQVAGTALLVGVAGLLAAPVGLGLGLVLSEYARPAAGRWLRTLTLTLGGVPSILLGLWGYWLFSVRLGWGKSWLAGAVVLAVVAVPPVVIAVASALAALPAGRREAALALGLRRDQLVRSVLVPQAVPGLVTGLLLGLARAAGETAPLLFAATVFNGAPVLPAGIRQSPVSSLPTHIFVLAQDAADPAALRAAWGAALALVVLAGLLVAGAVPARRWMQRTAS